MTFDKTHIITLLIALSFGTGYHFFDKSSDLEEENINIQLRLNESENALGQLGIEMIELKSDLEERKEAYLKLQEENRDFIMEVEKLKNNDSRHNNEIDDLIKQINSEKERVERLIWTEEQFDLVKLELQDLRDELLEQQEEIVRLKEENASYKAIIRKLNSELEEAEKTINKYNDNGIQKEKDPSPALIKTITADVSSFEVKTYDIKKDKYKNTLKAKKVKSIYSCFEFDTHFDKNKNEEKFYLRMIYGGVTLYSEQLGSGEITLNDDTQMRYTLQPKVRFNDDNSEGCIEWKLGEKLKKGNYTVELYNNGYLVGTDQFKLK